VCKQDGRQGRSQDSEQGVEAMGRTANCEDSLTPSFLDRQLRRLAVIRWQEGHRHVSTHVDDRFFFSKKRKPLENLGKRI
jgi:hypothetical protein